jgi:hypothetical protein
MPSPDLGLRPTLEQGKRPELRGIQHRLLYRVQSRVDGQELVEYFREDSDLELGEEIAIYARREGVYAIQPLRAHKGEAILEGQWVEFTSELVNYGGTYFVGGEPLEIDRAIELFPDRFATFKYYKSFNHKRVIEVAPGIWKPMEENDQVITKPEQRSDELGRITELFRLRETPTINPWER